MTSKEIVDAVTSYVRDENVKYAILIDGAWGSGKTFLYENDLCDAISDIEIGKNDRKANVYISLYGVSSIEALSKQLLINYLIYVKANGNEMVKKGVKPVAGILGVVSKAFSFSIGSFSADFSEILQDISGLLEAKNMVVCFDDLERCSIPINEFFGYVNNLIEHCNCKVLILADENNIGKIYANTNIEQKYQTILTGDRKVIQDISEEDRKKNATAKDSITIKELKELNERLYSENFIYRDIKEKVIGKTCHYYPGIKESLEKLISGTDIEIIKENIEYDYYIEYGDWKDKALYDELFEVICEVVCVKHKTVRIAGEDYPYELVKSKFLKLNSSHLNYVIGCMKNTTTKITNIKAYMVTTLYNAPSTINHYYQQEVQHDMYGGGWHEKGIV